VSDQPPIEKIRNLPPEKVAEVEEFVDFLTTGNEGQSGRCRLRSAMGAEPSSSFPVGPGLAKRRVMFTVGVTFVPTHDRCKQIDDHGDDGSN
jgi:hypothetical protein